MYKNKMHDLWSGVWRSTGERRNIGQMAQLDAVSQLRPIQH